MLNEEMIEKTKEIANSIKIYSIGNKAEVKSKEKADKIKNIAEKEIEKNGK